MVSGFDFRHDKSCIRIFRSHYLHLSAISLASFRFSTGLNFQSEIKAMPGCLFYSNSVRAKEMRRSKASERQNRMGTCGGPL
jgi:hypothetical protein